MSVTTVADALAAAADLIEPQGAWTQGAFSRCSTSWCVLGAIEAVAEKPKLFSRVPRDEWLRVRADAFLKAHLGSVDVSLWNDEPSRTQAEVVDTLRDAAAKAREQGL